MKYTGHSKISRQLNHLTDFLMIVLMPMLMAYSLIGETFHEVAGTLMLLLFVLHQIFHFKWWKAMFRGKYTPYRTMVTVLNITLLILMILQPLAGILLSKHLYTFLSVNGMSAQARSVHMAAAYWLYVLMSFHIGLHVDSMWRSLKRKIKIRMAAELVLRLAVLVLIVCGIRAFILRGLPGYMLLRTQFAFFDTNESRLLFLADYLAVIVLFAACGYCAGKFLKGKKRKTGKIIKKEHFS
jgi:hypothetical protein